MSEPEVIYLNGHLCTPESFAEHLAECRAMLENPPKVKRPGHDDK